MSSSDSPVVRRIKTKLGIIGRTISVANPDVYGVFVNLCEDFIDRLKMFYSNPSMFKIPVRFWDDWNKQNPLFSVELKIPKSERQVRVMRKRKLQGKSLPWYKADSLGNVIPVDESDSEDE